MNKKKIINKIIELIEPIINGHKLELIDVEFVKEGDNWILRVYIDTPQNERPINIEDCSIISKAINNIIDQVDIPVSSYNLEVSSPGVNRILKSDRDFNKFTDRKVKVKLFKTISGEKTLVGKLKFVDSYKVVIELNTLEFLEIPRNNIVQVQLTDE